MPEKLTFELYSRQAHRTDRYTPRNRPGASAPQSSTASDADYAEAIDIALLAMISKVGLAASIAKRLHRHKSSHEEEPSGSGGSSDVVLSGQIRAMCREELGDLLWYMVLLLRNIDYLLQSVAGNDCRTEFDLGAIYCDFLKVEASRRGQSLRAPTSDMSIKELSDIAKNLRGGTECIDPAALVAMVRNALAAIARAVGEIANTASGLYPANRGELNIAGHDVADQDEIELLDSGQFEHHLGSVLWDIDLIASLVEHDLAEIAAWNIDRARNHHGEFDDTEPAQYNEGLDERYQFPQQMTFELMEVLKTENSSLVSTQQGAERYVRIVKIGLIGDDRDDRYFIGDPLDDNARVEDGYRFHDVFHLAHATVLGWSPLLRRLLDAKRRGQHHKDGSRYGASYYDQVQDGARAIFTEESLAALVFRSVEVPSEDGSDGYFDCRRLDAELFRIVKHMVRGLEVEDQSIVVWRHAYERAFRIIEQLKESSRIIGERDGQELHDGSEYSVGYIHCDLLAREITYGTTFDNLTERLTRESAA